MHATLEPDYEATVGRAIIEEPLPKLTVRETAEIAAWWSAVWFLANWSLNAALAWSSVASVTILSSTTSECKRGWALKHSNTLGFFTLTLGRIFHVEDITRAKLFSAVARCVSVWTPKPAISFC